MVVGKVHTTPGSDRAGGKMAADVVAKKGLGQHWLNDQLSLQAMCDAAEVKAGDHVLEIGPGMGSLTKVLLDRGAEIFAIEYDQEAVNYLNKHMDSSALIVEQADIRTFDLHRMPSDYKIVANIPYYLTSNLVQIISESDNSPVKAVLLVQKEVAERICADVGSMSLLSVSAQFYWQTELRQKVPASLFTPSPKVDSQIVVLTKRDEPLFEVDQKQFFRLVKAGFAARRKTLLNSLSGGLRVNKTVTNELLESAGIAPTKRPQDLSVNDWYELYKCAVSRTLL